MSEASKTQPATAGEQQRQIDAEQRATLEEQRHEQIQEQVADLKESARVMRRDAVALLQKSTSLREQAHALEESDRDAQAGTESDRGRE